MHASTSETPARTTGLRVLSGTRLPKKDMLSKDSGSSLRDHSRKRGGIDGPTKKSCKKKWSMKGGGRKSNVDGQAGGGEWKETPIKGKVDQKTGEPQVLVRHGTRTG